MKYNLAGLRNAGSGSASTCAAAHVLGLGWYVGTKAALTPVLCLGDLAGITYFMRGRPGRLSGSAGPEVYVPVRKASKWPRVTHAVT